MKVAGAADVGEHIAAGVVEHDQRAVADAAIGKFGEMIAKRRRGETLQICVEGRWTRAHPSASSNLAATCGASFQRGAMR